MISAVSLLSSVVAFALCFSISAVFVLAFGVAYKLFPTDWWFNRYVNRTISIMLGLMLLCIVLANLLRYVRIGE